MPKGCRKEEIPILPKVSIIIPVYNVEAYIRRCIESVIGQIDYNSFEVIIVNDGTTDGSIEEIKDLILKHDNIFLVNQENSGLSEARNIGIRCAKGEFLSFIDSDDWIEPEMISTMYNAAVQTKSEIAVCNIRKVYADNSRLVRNITHGFEKKTIVSSTEAVNYFFEHKKIKGHVCNKIYRAELFKDYNVFFPKYKNYEDLPASFVLLWHSKNVVFLDGYFYNYLQRKGSITQKINSNFWHLIENVYLIQEFLVHKNKYDFYSKKFLSLLITSLFSVYIHLEKHKEDENYHMLKQQLNAELRKIELKKVILFSWLHPLIRLKYLIMFIRFDFPINLLLKMKSLKNKTTM